MNNVEFREIVIFIREIDWNKPGYDKISRSIRINVDVDFCRRNEENALSQIIKQIKYEWDKLYTNNMMEVNNG